MSKFLEPFLLISSKRFCFSYHWPRNTMSNSCSHTFIESWDQHSLFSRLTLSGNRLTPSCSEFWVFSIWQIFLICELMDHVFPPSQADTAFLASLRESLPFKLHHQPNVKEHLQNKFQNQRAPVHILWQSFHDLLLDSWRTLKNVALALDILRLI